MQAYKETVLAYDFRLFWDSRYAPEQTGAGSLCHRVSHLDSQLHAGRDQGKGKEPKKAQGECNIQCLIV